ncbi:MAG: hypothetical protein K6F79_07420 [Saccharofermentans sp.]|nr:hypothetical protein [Saccharofermentans sp.]
MIKRITAAVLTVAISMLAFAGCGSKTDEFVTIDNVNQSSINVAEGFFQSVFTGDEEMFCACYPDSFKEFVNADGEQVDMHQVFEQYTSTSMPDYTYLGASVSAYNDYVEENNYDFPSLQIDISVIHHMEVEQIEAAQIVKLRLNFQNGEGEHVTTDVYILVYKSGSAWYVFELQNSDAEFAV